jgi:methionine synthase II (cobalamin-independent)
MQGQTEGFGLIATGMGSVPFENVVASCREIMESLPYIPFWPQFVKRSFLEDMNIQYSEGLPLLVVNENKRSLMVSENKEREAALVEFYEHFLAQDLEYFAISRDYAFGLYALLEEMKKGLAPEARFIKGQIVGPVTFASSIAGIDGKPVIYDQELSEALTKGLAAKALWQANILKSSGKRPIIFLDEPSLTGFGSAFSAIQRHEVVQMLRTIMDYVRENSDAIMGIHCCGNTDWSMILEAEPDIVNFDAFEFMEHFLLYEKDIEKFFNGGGNIAWGIVPTTDFNSTVTVEELSLLLEKGFSTLEKIGVDRDLIINRSLLTPACGMGTMSKDMARAAVSLLSDLSREMMDGNQ